MVKKLQDSLHETVQTVLHDHSQQFGDVSYAGVDGKVPVQQTQVRPVYIVSSSNASSSQHGHSPFQEKLKVLIDRQDFAGAFQSVS